MKSYAEKLKDPRWQKRRLEVLNRDGFRCTHCQNDDKTLHVHHLTYSKGTEPWDYELCYYTTLCKDCHSEVETVICETRKLIGGMVEAMLLIKRIDEIIHSSQFHDPLTMCAKIESALDAAGLPK